MKRLPFLILLILLIPLCLCLRLSAQESAPDSDDQNLIDRPHAQDWITDIDRAWLAGKRRVGVTGGSVTWRPGAGRAAARRVA